VIKADSPTDPAFVYRAQIIALEKRRFFDENSQGETSLTPTIMPIPLPSGSAAYTWGSLGTVAIRTTRSPGARVRRGDRHRRL
jgi:hypothetical protein